MTGLSQTAEIPRPLGEERVSRLDGADALRGVAVLAVLLFHYTARFPPDYLRYDQPVWGAVYGWIGVELFFVISGYCIAMTAARCPTLSRFWARRFSRLQPAYLAAVMLTFAVVAAFGLPGRETSLRDALGNLVWLEGLGIVPSVDGVYWTLVVEIKLYLVFGIVFYMLKGRDPVFWFASLCLAGAASLWVDRTMLAGELASRSIEIATFMFPSSGFFLGGMLLFFWRSTSTRGRALAGMAYAASCFHLAATDPVLGGLTALLLPAVALALTRRKLPLAAPLVWIGLISYPLYLIHQNVGIVIIRETVGIVPSAYGRILIATLIVLALAATLSLAVEHRFRHLLEGPAERLLSWIGRTTSPIASALVRDTRRPRSSEAASGST